MTVPSDAEPVVVAIGETPETMVTDVLLTNVGIAASDLIRDSFERAR